MRISILFYNTSPHRLGACWQKVHYLRARVESFLFAMGDTASVLLYWASFQFVENMPSHFAVLVGSAFAFLFGLLKKRQVILLF
jgi:hypothetical protein